MSSVSHEFPQVKEGVSGSGGDRDGRLAGRSRRPSTWVFVLGAVVGLVVSVDTSWRFFGEKLGVINPIERAAMFAGMEIVLVACGLAMFEGVRRKGGTPGPARLLAWALCGASAYAAIELSGTGLGVARVVFGPVLSVIALHFALGVELRARGGKRAGTAAKVGRELRERFLSRLGLADDERDALGRTRDRAALRVARLSVAPRWTVARSARLRRALRASNVAHDLVQRDRMLAELAVIKHMTGLATLTVPSPWAGQPVDQLGADAPVLVRQDQLDEPRPVEPVAVGLPVGEDQAPVEPLAEDAPTGELVVVVDDDHAREVANRNKADALRYVFPVVGVTPTDEGKSLVPQAVAFLAARGRLVDTSYAYDVHRRWREAPTNGHRLVTSG
jgi:hypothetical protein